MINGVIKNRSFLSSEIMDSRVSVLALLRFKCFNECPGPVRSTRVVRHYLINLQEECDLNAI